MMGGIARNVRAKVPVWGLCAIILLASGAFAACGPEGLVYFQKQDIASKQGWHKDSVLLFNFPVDDTAAAYSLSFLLKHTTAYPNANLYLFVELESPVGSLVQDTVGFLLCTPQGQWYGKGIGDGRRLLLPYAKDLKFRFIGEHTLRVRQGMRYDFLPAIESLALQVQMSPRTED